MIKTAAIILINLLFTVLAFGADKDASKTINGNQSWNVICQNDQFSKNKYPVNFAFWQDKAYAAFSDIDNSSKLTVLKCDNGNWQTVGQAAFTKDGADYISMFVQEGMPFVAFQDDKYDGRISVMKYTGSKWKYIGKPGFTEADASNTKLYVYKNTPYVAFVECGTDFKLSVMKYEWGKWTYVGKKCFASTTTTYPSLLVRSGVPYIAFPDTGKMDRISVMKFYGNKWQYVGKSGFSSGVTWDTSLYVDNAAVYVTYGDSGDVFIKKTVNKIKVMKFDGNTWNELKNFGYSGKMDNAPSIAVANNIPYVAYNDGSYLGGLTVKKYIQGKWINVGNPGFSPAAGEGVLHIYNNRLYIGFSIRIEKADDLIVALNHI